MGSVCLFCLQAFLVLSSCCLSQAWSGPKMRKTDQNQNKKSNHQYSQRFSKKLKSKVCHRLQRKKFHQELFFSLTAEQIAPILQGVFMIAFWELLTRLLYSKM